MVSHLCTASNIAFNFWKFAFFCFPWLQRSMWLVCPYGATIQWVPPTLYGDIRLSRWHLLFTENAGHVFNTWHLHCLLSFLTDYYCYFHYLSRYWGNEKVYHSQGKLTGGGRIQTCSPRVETLYPWRSRTLFHDSYVPVTYIFAVCVRHSAMRILRNLAADKAR